MPNLQEIFTTVSIVCHHYETRRFAKSFRHYSALSKKRLCKSFRRNCIQVRRNVAFGTLKKPKLAQILEQSSGTRQVGVSVFFHFWSLYKTNKFHVAVGLFSYRSQKTSKCAQNITDTLACGSCSTSMFLPHFDVLNRHTATWNLFVKLTHDITTVLRGASIIKSKTEGYCNKWMWLFICMFA